MPRASARTDARRSPRRGTRRRGCGTRPPGGRRVRPSATRVRSMAASFSADGSRVVTASQDKTARVWDAATGLPVGEPLRHERTVHSASFSPDGSRIVTASDDKTARVWDAATGRPLGKPLQHRKGVCIASFSPDGACVLTAGSLDDPARCGTRRTGESIGEPCATTDSVSTACFSPDGSRVVTASWDKTARCGMRLLVSPWVSPCVTRRGSFVSASAPTGRAWSPLPTTSRRGCGTRPLGQAVGEPLRHDGSVTARGLQPRWVERRHRLWRTVRVCGTRPPGGRRESLSATRAR